MRRKRLIGLLGFLAVGLMADSQAHAQTGSGPGPSERLTFDTEMIRAPEVREVVRRCPGWWPRGQTEAARVPHAQGGGSGPYGAEYGQGPAWWQRFRQQPTKGGPPPGELSSVGPSSAPTPNDPQAPAGPGEVRRANAASGVLLPAAVGIPLKFQGTWRSEFDRMNPHLPPKGVSTGALVADLRTSAQQEDLIVGSVEFRGHPNFQDAWIPVFGFAVRGDGKLVMRGTHVTLIGCHPNGTPLSVTWMVEQPPQPEFSQFWGNISGWWHAGFPPSPDYLRYPLRSYDFGSFVIQGVSSPPTAAVKPGAPSPVQAGRPSAMPGPSPPARPSATISSPAWTTTPSAVARTPTISGISPNPVPGLDGLQTLTFMGGGFAAGARVTLRRGGEVFPIPVERTSVLGEAQIQVRANVTSQPAAWTAEVMNPDGRVSNRFTFTVSPSSVASSPPPPARPPANRPPSIEGLGQYMADGKTAIPEGGTTPEGTVVFKAVVIDPDSDQVRLEVELRQMGERLTGEPTLETVSAFVTSGSLASITRWGLVPVGYRWRARAVDNHGAAGKWVEFGVPGNTDFAVARGGPLTVTTPAGTSSADVEFAELFAWGSSDADFAARLVSAPRHDKPLSPRRGGLTLWSTASDVLRDLSARAALDVGVLDCEIATWAAAADAAGRQVVSRVGTQLATTLWTGALAPLLAPLSLPTRVVIREALYFSVQLLNDAAFGVLDPVDIPADAARMLTNITIGLVAPSLVQGYQEGRLADELQRRILEQGAQGARDYLTELVRAEDLTVFTAVGRTTGLRGFPAVTSKVSLVYNPWTRYVTLSMRGGGGGCSDREAIFVVAYEVEPFLFTVREKEGTRLSFRVDLQQGLCVLRWSDSWRNPLIPSSCVKS